MNYYFEFPDNIVGKTYSTYGGSRTVSAKYCVRYTDPHFEPLMPSKLSYLANRIWAEDSNGKITYVKNRSNTMNTPVDLKEFLWVKLSAREV